MVHALRLISRVFIGPAITLGTILFLCAIFEIAARIVLPPQQSIEVLGTASRPASSDPRSAVEAQERIDSVMVYGDQGVRLRPNLTALIHNHRLSHRDIEISTNELGLRDGPVGPKPADEYRILVLGDSITIGDYVPTEETYPAMLQTELRASGKNVRVLNAGLPGASLKEEYYHYLELRDAVKADLVLVGLYLNDSQNSKNFYMRSLSEPWRHSAFITFLSKHITFLKAQLWSEDALPEQIDPSWREDFRAGRDLKSGDMLRDQDAMDFEVYNAYDDFGLAWNPQSWITIRKLLHGMANHVAASGSDFGVFLFPVHYQIKAITPDTRPQASFASVCNAEKITCFDPLPALREAWSNGEQDILYDHCHYKAAGNKIVARALRSWVQTDF